MDVYRRRFEPAINFLDYCFFISFFPKLVAGPIVRAADFIPQIRSKIQLEESDVGRAVFLIAGGLFKKAVISDYISTNFVDRVFDSPALYSGFENLMAVYGYALQIYCDFSGYSDMAIGLALMMGFRIPMNFDAPYQSTSITEFWRRWHISLSTWLRDYLYISLGGNRSGKLRQYLNLMITMLLGGLWHGASWKFVVWGGLHGAALAIEKAILSVVKIPAAFVFKLIGGLLTFHFVCFCWIFFRASSFENASQVVSQISGSFNISLVPDVIVGYGNVFLLLIFGYLLHLLPARIDTKVEDRLTSSPLFVKSLILAAVIYLVIQVRSADIQPFIYFQF
ncbi:MAG: MBOAT family O-acyltransferase [Bacteroidota bacterium]